MKKHEKNMKKIWNKIGKKYGKNNQIVSNLYKKVIKYN